LPSGCRLDPDTIAVGAVHDALTTGRKVLERGNRMSVSPFCSFLRLGQRLRFARPTTNESDDAEPCAKQAHRHGLGNFAAALAWVGEIRDAAYANLTNVGQGVAGQNLD
jgi:hypothetical protein